MWRDTAEGLDCMPFHSRLETGEGYWLRRVECSELRQSLVFEHFNLQDKWLAERLRSGWSFEQIVDELYVSLGEHRRRVREYREAISEAHYRAERFCRTGEMSEQLAYLLLKVSNLDALHRTMRSNFLPPGADAEFVEQIPRQEIDDLLAMYRIIPEDLFRGERVFLNPDLSILNRDIRPQPRKLVAGGVSADADIIVDDLLLDIKTSKDRITKSLPLHDFCQLMGYFALSSLEGKHRIRKLGIYYARFGYLFEFKIPRAVPNSGGRPAFLEWFRKCMRIDKRRLPEFKAQ